jgi:hypothetical protein
MEKLNTICKTKLDNADVSLFISTKEDEITLKFIVRETREIVVFKCSNILTLSMTKDYEDTDNCYFVGETSVSIIDTKSAVSKTGWNYGDRTLPAHWYKISLEGGIELEIVCGNFVWEIQDIPKE